MMWSMIEGLPDQYRWAARLEAPELTAAASILVCGMGGSGISGDFAAVVAAEAGIDVRVHKDYGLPTWVGTVRPLVIAASYSGNTAETLSAVEAARRLDLDVAVVSTGGELVRIAADMGYPSILIPPGLQPRAALGYLVGAVLQVLAGAGALPDPAQTLLESATATETLLGSGDPGTGREPARAIATALAGRVPIIWGSAGPSEVAAQRWAKQINENAKLPAYSSIMPEIDHNEIVGWGSLPAEVSRGFGIVILRDRGEEADVSRRFDLTVELLRDQAPFVGEVWSSGESVLARAATTALIGDLVSIFLAEAAGVDPVQVDIITQLKDRL